MTKKKLPENIQKWVDALRSGHYKQVKDTLKGKMEDGTVGFCCLGVYCDINGREVKTEYPNEYGDFNFDGSPRHYSWLERQVGEVIVDLGAGMNDDGHSFSEIADKIEEEYLKEDS